MARVAFDDIAPAATDTDSEPASKTISFNGPANLPAPSVEEQTKQAYAIAARDGVLLYQASSRQRQDAIAAGMTEEIASYLTERGPILADYLYTYPYITEKVPELMTVAESAAEIGKGLVRGGERFLGMGGGLMKLAVEYDPSTSWNPVERLVGTYSKRLEAQFPLVKKRNDRWRKSVADMGVRWHNYWRAAAAEGFEAPSPKYLSQTWSMAPVTKALTGTTESVPLFAGALGLSYLTKSPYAGLALIGTFTAGEKYAELTEADVNKSVAQNISMLYGTWEAATSLIPFTMIFKSPVKSALGAFILDATFESFQEFIAGIGENFLTYFGLDYDPDKNWTDQNEAVRTGFAHLFDNWMDNVVVGFVLGGAAGSPFSMAQQARVKKEMNNRRTALDKELSIIVEARRARAEARGVEKAGTLAAQAAPEIKKLQKPSVKPEPIIIVPVEIEGKRIVPQPDTVDMTDVELLTRHGWTVGEINKHLPASHQQKRVADTIRLDILRNSGELTEQQTIRNVEQPETARVLPAKTKEGESPAVLEEVSGRKTIVRRIVAPELRRAASRMLESGQTDYTLFEKAAQNILQRRSAGERAYLIKPVWEYAKELHRIKKGLPRPPSPIRNLDAAVEYVNSKIADIKQLRKEDAEQAITQLRSRQAARETGVLRKEIKKGTSKWEAISKSKGGFKDKAEIPEYTPFNFTPEQLEAFAERILDLYPAERADLAFYRIAARDAIDMLDRGKVPANYDFEMLEPILGADTVGKIYQRLARTMNTSENKWRHINHISGLIKLIKFGLGDIQYFRQATTMLVPHPLEYLYEGKTSLISFASDKYARMTEIEVTLDPQYKKYKKLGLRLLSSKAYAGEEATPEQFMGQTPEWLAQAGKKRGIVSRAVTAPVRAAGKLALMAERSLTASIDWTMLNLVHESEKTFRSKGFSGAELDKLLANRIGVINSLVKLVKAKSSTGKAVMRTANLILTSPSMTFSRPYLIWQALANEGSRMYAISAILGNIAKIQLLAYLTKLLVLKFRPDDDTDEPYIDADVNPFSSTWGQCRVGKSHYDPSHGDANYYGMLLRFIAGIKADQLGGIRKASRAEILHNYVSSRESPLLTMGGALLTGKDWLGNPIYVAPDWVEEKYDEAGVYIYTAGRELLKLAEPSTLENIYEAADAEGMPAAVLSGAMSVLSMGVSTYEQPAYIKEAQTQDKLAMAEYGKKFDELTPEEQESLAPYLTEETIASRKESIRRQSYMRYYGIEQKDIHRRLTAGLAPSTRDELDAVGAHVGSISRNTIVNRLSDERFKRYEKEALSNLAVMLDSLFAEADYQSSTVDEKYEQVTDTISEAKRVARETLADLIDEGEI